MEVTDFDGETRVLSGLQPPSNRYALYQQRYVTSWPDRKIQDELKTIAVRLYNHQKMTPMFQSNVCNGKNTLAYMVSTSYEGSPPSTPQVKLKTSIPLPLGHWDRLYYAIVAEVRSTYEALQQEFGSGFENGATILHNAGLEGANASSRQPFSAIGLAAALEDMWDTVNDIRLTSALDFAVRIRYAQDQDSDSEDNSEFQNAEEDADDETFGFWETKKRSFKHEHDEDCHCVSAAEGLVDVHDMTPVDIIKMLWVKEIAEGRRKSGRRSEYQTLLARCRAEVRELSPHKRSPSKGSHAITAVCRCNSGCDCREACDFQKKECACAVLRNQVCTMIAEQEETHGAAHYAYDTPEQQLPNNVLGAVTNDVAQMQVAALAEPTRDKIDTLKAAREASEQYDRHVLSRQRGRADTNDSDLAYVPPPRTPTRAYKDMYPLGFYGDLSGQRYPSLRSKSMRDHSPSPVYGASFYSDKIPKRKPVPVPTSLTLEGMSSTGGVMYPKIPPSESQGMFTQSFPTAAAGNPRDSDDMATSYADLTKEAHNAIRPFSEEPTLYGNPVTYPDSPTLRPTLLTTNTSPADILTVPKRSTGGTTSTNSTANTSFHTATSSTSAGSDKESRPSLDLFNKPFPPLPQPEFMAPRPAQKQRYVSAGGNAKLSERQEIAGPAFDPLACAAQSSGAAIPKEELLAKLSDPEFVRAHFGEEAVTKMCTPNGGAGGLSADSSPRSKRSSGGKKKRESREISVIKRERTESGESGASGRLPFDKLRRVFSRKNSQCD